MVAKKTAPEMYSIFDTIDDVEPSDVILRTLNLDPSQFSKMMIHTQEWILTNVLSLNTAIQCGVIAACIILGTLLGRLLSARVGKFVETLHVSTGTKNLMHRFHRLTGPIFILFFLLLSLVGISLSGLELPYRLIDAALRLVTAWIIIKIAVKVVRNSFMRKLIGGSILLIAALSIFGILDDVTMVLDKAAITMGAFRLSALIVIKAIYVTMILAYGALGLAALIERQTDHIVALTPGSRLLISKITRMLLVSTAVMIGLSMAGVNLAMLAVFSGAIGLGAGLGLQNGVANLFTGIMLLLDRTIQPGDIIELDNGAYGTVRTMGSRCTEITTMDQKSYLIPNADLVAKRVINWSRSGSNLQLNVEFGVGLDQDPRKIIALATAATAKAKRVMRNPPPSCKLKNFKDNGALEFILIFWIDDANHGIINVKSEVLLHLWEALKENNATIPYTPKTIYQPVPPVPSAAPAGVAPVLPLTPLTPSPTK